MMLIADLTVCLMSGRLHRCKTLLDHGAEVNRADHSGQTPIHVAAKHGHEALVCSLLQYGADPKVKVMLTLNSLNGLRAVVRS